MGYLWPTWHHADTYSEPAPILKEYPEFDFTVLANVYHGCSILTGDKFNASFFSLSDTNMLDELGNHNLVPPFTFPESHLNVIPLGPEVDAFIKGMWTVYPTEKALLRCISIEEQMFMYRRLRILNGQGDKKSWGHNTKYSSNCDILPNSWFDVWFSDSFPTKTITRRNLRTNMLETFCTYDKESEFPEFPPILLLAHVNIIVRTRTSVLKLMDPVHARAKRQLSLGQYLMALWASTPLNFDSLSRPHGLESLEVIQARVCQPAKPANGIRYSARYEEEIAWAETHAMILSHEIDTDDKTCMVFDHLENFGIALNDSDTPCPVDSRCLPSTHP